MWEKMLMRHWRQGRAVEVCLREELGDLENEVGFREKTFHRNKVLGKGGRSLDRWCIGPE